MGDKTEMMETEEKKVCDKEGTVVTETKEEGGDVLDIEPVLQALGPRGIGFYQITQMMLVLSQLFALAFSIISIVFIGYQPEHRCADVNTSTLATLVGKGDNSSDGLAVVYGKCDITVTTNQSGQVDVHSLPCVGGFQYDGFKEQSFFTEWDLTCEKSGLTELTQTLMMVGQGVGSLFFTSLADRLGRKVVNVTCTLLLGLAALATALAPNYAFFVVCRIATGAFQQGSALVGFTMFVELLPKYLRGASVIIDGTLWAICVMTLPGLAWLLQDYSWRTLQFAIAASSVFSLIAPFCLDESLRWLVANGRKEDAERILKKASRQNNVDYANVRAALATIFHEHAQQTNGATALLSSNESTKEMSSLPITNGDSLLSANAATDTLLGTDNAHERKGPVKALGTNQEPISDSVTAEDGEEKVKTKKYTFRDILVNPKLRVTALVIWYTWVCNSLTYYGLMLTSSSLAGNRFFNFFLQALMELPAYITSFFAIRVYGRKNVITAFSILTAVSLVTLGLLQAFASGPAMLTASNVLSLVGKYGVSGSFGTLYIYCPELFPTNLRTAGIGFASSMARIGGMIAPYSKNLADVVAWGPGMVLGAMAGVSAYVIQKLPETRGRPLPTTVEEMTSWNETTNPRNLELIIPDPSPDKTSL